MHADDMRLTELSGRVIGCAFTVLNTLGAGHLEKVCENGSAHEPRKAGLKTTSSSDEGHRAQCLNYLKASSLQLCLLLNFGKSRLEIKRVANGR